MSSNEKVNVQVSKELLTKLSWALPMGSDEERIEFLVKEAIEKGEKEEGVTYPSDRLPGNDFEGMSLKS